MIGLPDRGHWTDLKKLVFRRYRSGEWQSEDDWLATSIHHSLFTIHRPDGYWQ
jgi:hypothetical protein